jgi:hypothetical protein
VVGFDGVVGGGLVGLGGGGHCGGVVVY